MLFIGREFRLSLPLGNEVNFIYKTSIVILDNNNINIICQCSNRTDETNLCIYVLQYLENPNNTSEILLYVLDMSVNIQIS